MSDSRTFDKLQRKAREIKRNLFVLFLAYQDPRVSWFAKCIAVCVVAYAFSPIDLIPDFIPVLGYLDDLILVPLGIALALRMIPPAVIEECRAKAEEIRSGGKPKNWIAGALIVAVWLLLGFWLGTELYEAFR
ncbi:DUF1232 domain-containing protein [Cohnella sp. CFH 77786]|uniref:YkvA family protein n=1 Tax=Cohnella sp. CFH 77786 TaxID=2662265 RepID=UPI001C610B22|nr:YkvA family protein [Cohnella sp. CFH 77786]MBW5446436.1 DUF1232 domain-containing protein [Cohnella sp. CFH 77786]